MEFHRNKSGQERANAAHVCPPDKPPSAECEDPGSAAATVFFFRTSSVTRRCGTVVNVRALPWRRCGPPDDGFGRSPAGSWRLCPPRGLGLLSVPRGLQPHRPKSSGPQKEPGRTGFLNTNNAVQGPLADLAQVGRMATGSGEPGPFQGESGEVRGGAAALLQPRRLCGAPPSLMPAALQGCARHAAGEHTWGPWDLTAMHRGQLLPTVPLHPSILSREHSQAEGTSSHAEAAATGAAHGLSRRCRD